MGKKGKSKADANASSSSAAITKKRYALADLDTAFLCKVQEYHPSDFDTLYNQLPELKSGKDPEPLPAKQKAKVIALIKEFQEYLDKFRNDEKYNNLDEAYSNSEYYRCTYSLNIGILYLFLGQKKEAFHVLHTAMMENSHPQVTFLLYWLESYDLSIHDDTLLYIYYEKTVRCLFLLTGNSRQNNEIKIAIESFGYQSRYEFLSETVKVLFLYYQEKKIHDKMFDLLVFLYQRFDTIRWLHPAEKNEKNEKNLLVLHMQSLLFELLIPLIQVKKYKEADSLFERFEKCVGLSHHKLMTSQLYFEIANDKENIDLLRMYLRHASGGENYGDLESMVFKASVLLFNSAVVLKDNSAPLKAKSLINQVLAKLPTFDDLQKNTLEGSCYHLLGHYYEEFVPIHSREGKTRMANCLQNYTKAADLDNVLGATRLVLLYISGEKCAQDLDKAEALLIKLQQKENSSWYVRKLANVKLLKSSFPANASNRKVLLQQGIDLITNHVSTTDNLPSYELCELNYYLALLLIALDAGVHKKVYDNETFIYDVLCSYEICDIEDNTYPNAQRVCELIEQSMKYEHMHSYYLMGLLTHYGTYLEQNFAIAEECYKFCHDWGHNVAEEQAGLNLVLHSQETDAQKKKDYLLKAVSCHRLSVELAESMEYKLWLEENFSMLVHSFLENKTHSSPPKDKQKSAARAKRPNINRQADTQLESAIVAVTNHLKMIGTQNAKYETTLVDLVDTVSFVLSNVKNQIPSLVDFLPDLYQLIQNMHVHFTEFKLKTKIDIIKNISYWPLLAEESGPLANMLTLTRPKEDIELSDRLSILMALIHLKHKNGTFDKEIIRVLSHKYKVGALQKISNAARIVYLWAIIHVNCTDAKIKGFLEEDFKLGKEDVLAFIANNTSGMSSEYMSQIYHGLHYLSIVFPEHFSNFDPKVKKIMDLSAETLQRKEAVTISNMQQNFYFHLATLDARFQHEVFVGGRPVDFYNSDTNEIIELQGPSHYLYNKEGEPVALKPATVLCEQSLKLQGFKVLRADYFIWARQKTENDRLDFLRSIVPSCKNKSPTTSPGNSPDTFFNNNNAKGKAVKAVTVCATMNV